MRMLSLVRSCSSWPRRLGADADGIRGAAPPDVAAPPADATEDRVRPRDQGHHAGQRHRPSRQGRLVTVHYTGWKTDGTMFDSSVTAGKPRAFRVNRVIAGFSEGLQLMVVGEKRRLWIPEALAYKGAREPKGMLVFDIELISTSRRAPPADVKAPPADAKKTASGLAYKVLHAGHRRPASAGRTARSPCTTRAGRPTARCSTARSCAGSRRRSALDGVIAGWTEGLQLMFEGEKTRFWIPEKLAYEGKSAPYGMLVFDVELIKIIGAR